MAHPTFADLTGYTLADLKALGWRVLSHPADLPQVEGLCAALYAGRGGRPKCAAVTRAGAVLDLRLYAQAVPADPGALRFIVAAQDITAHKQAEAALRQQADEFAALYETARDVAVAHDLPALLETLVGRAATLLARARRRRVSL